MISFAPVCRESTATFSPPPCGTAASSISLSRVQSYLLLPSPFLAPHPLASIRMVRTAGGIPSSATEK